jgi:hypothetical protein
VPDFSAGNAADGISLEAWPGLPGLFSAASGGCAGRRPGRRALDCGRVRLLKPVQGMASFQKSEKRLTNGPSKTDLPKLNRGTAFKRASPHPFSPLMKRAFFPLLLVFFTLAGLSAGGAGELRDLILVAGQSNAVGFDASAAELPADAGDKDVLFWWRCGDPPPDEYDSTSRGWTTLQPQPRANPMPKTAGVGRQYGNFAKPDGGFGPEIGFARTLQARGKKSLALVKAAFSGTGMTTDWRPRDAGPSGACYRALVEETKNALEKAREKGITLRIRALVWVQGESDANATLAPQYARNLGEMITALRQDLGAPEMTALVGVNTHFGNGKNTFMPVIVEQQKQLAAGLERCVYVNTEGLSYANGAHFDTKGTLEMGVRFAEALLQAEGDGK